MSRCSKTPGDYSGVAAQRVPAGMVVGFRGVVDREWWAVQGLNL
jgi:hypothetical protein